MSTESPYASYVLLSRKKNKLTMSSERSLCFLCSFVKKKNKLTMSTKSPYASYVLLSRKKNKLTMSSERSFCFLCSFVKKKNKLTMSTESPYASYVLLSKHPLTYKKIRNKNLLRISLFCLSHYLMSTSAM